MQIAFVSLFLGLIVGVQPVELAVGERVARVELFLDGAPVGERGGPPWVLPVDLGDELAPHRLEAIARDAEGSEVGRATQWINLPRPQAEVEVVLDRGEAGRGAVAYLAWESVLGPEPSAVSATFDGAPLVTTDPRRLELPHHDPEQLHLLRVELQFSAHLGAVAEVVFGGSYGNDTAAELTAVPVTVASGRTTPEPAGMVGWFRVGDRRLTPVAIEEGPAEVVVVMDRPAQDALWRLSRRWGPGEAGPPRFDMLLANGQVMRFLWPFARGGGEGQVAYALFARSEDHPPQHGGLLWLLTAAQQPAFSRVEQRMADAVAVAAMSAAARGRRRAVLLILGDDPADASQYDPWTVRGYLARLGVPLVVWSTGNVTDGMQARWGDVLSVGRESWLRAAVRDLSRTLDEQRIVWVEGLHLPHEIRLSAGVSGIQLVR